MQVANLIDLSLSINFNIDRLIISANAMEKVILSGSLAVH